MQQQPHPARSRRAGCAIFCADVEGRTFRFSLCVVVVVVSLLLGCVFATTHQWKPPADVAVWPLAYLLYRREKARGIARAVSSSTPLLCVRACVNDTRTSPSRKGAKAQVPAQKGESRSASTPESLLSRPSATVSTSCNPVALPPSLYFSISLSLSFFPLFDVRLFSNPLLSWTHTHTRRNLSIILFLIAKSGEEERRKTSCFLGRFESLFRLIPDPVWVLPCALALFLYFLSRLRSVPAPLASDGCVSAEGNDTKNQSDYRLSLSLYSGKKKTRKVRHLPRKLYWKKERKKIDQSAPASFQWKLDSYLVGFFFAICVLGQSVRQFVLLLCSTVSRNFWHDEKKKTPKKKNWQFLFFWALGKLHHTAHVQREYYIYI